MNRRIVWIAIWTPDLQMGLRPHHGDPRAIERDVHMNLFGASAGFHDFPHDPEKDHDPVIYDAV